MCTTLSTVKMSMNIRRQNMEAEFEIETRVVTGKFALRVCQCSQDLFGTLNVQLSSRDAISVVQPHLWLAGGGSSGAERSLVRVLFSFTPLMRVSMSSLLLSWASGSGSGSWVEGGQSWGWWWGLWARWASSPWVTELWSWVCCPDNLSSCFCSWSPCW